MGGHLQVHGDRPQQSRGEHGFSLGASRRSQPRPHPEVGLVAPELEEDSMQPQEARTTAGRRGGLVGSGIPPTTLTPSPHHRARPPSQPCLPTLPEHFEAWDHSWKGPRIPAPPVGQTRGESKRFLSPVRRHRAPRPPSNLRTGRKAGEPTGAPGQRVTDQLPRQPGGTATLQAGPHAWAFAALSHTGVQLLPPAGPSPTRLTAADAGSPGSWHPLSGKVFIFPPAGSKRAP